MINPTNTYINANFTNLHLALLLASGLAMPACRAGAFEDLDALFSELHKDMLQMEERMLERFRKFDASLNIKTDTNGLAQIKADIKDEGDYVTITLQLPAQIGDNGVTIEAKQNALKGTVQTTDCKVKFDVAHNGQTFSYSCSNTREEKADQGGRYIASETYRQVTLPAVVADLENAQIERKAQTLTLRLPKAKQSAAPVNTWKKLAVQDQNSVK